MTTKFVIAVPGRTAFTSPAATKKFTSVPQSVVWNNYLEELLTVHGDIEVVDPAQYLRRRNTERNAAKSS